MAESAVSHPMAMALDGAANAAVPSAGDDRMNNAISFLKRNETRATTTMWMRPLT